MDGAQFIHTPNISFPYPPTCHAGHISHLVRIPQVIVSTFQWCPSLLGRPITWPIKA